MATGGGGGGASVWDRGPTSVTMPWTTKSAPIPCSHPRRGGRARVRVDKALSRQNRELRAGGDGLDATVTTRKLPPLLRGHHVGNRQCEIKHAELDRGQEAIDCTGLDRHVGGGVPRHRQHRHHEQHQSRVSASSFSNPPSRSERNKQGLHCTPGPGPARRAMGI